MSKSPRASIADRFRLLDPGAQRIVGCAALIGYRPDVSLLVACGDESTQSTIAALERACVLELLVVESRSPSRYRFRHALTQAAIRETLGKDQERMFHARIAAAIEGLPDAPSRVDQLAHHWSEAEDQCRADLYSRRAAQESARLGLTETPDMTSVEG